LLYYYIPGRIILYPSSLHIYSEFSEDIEKKHLNNLFGRIEKEGMKKEKEQEKEQKEDKDF